MKRIVIFAMTMALLFPGTISAQTQTKPADVPDYVPVAVEYTTDGLGGQIGDGSTPRGGTMPVLAKQPADIPSTATGWKVVDNSAVQTCADSLATKECKSRFQASISHLSFDDPIRNPGQPGGSHCHEFFGSTSANFDSTYASLRNRANAAAAAGKPASTFAGGPYNATAYWFPCPVITNAFGDGKDYAVKPYRLIIYYVDNPGTLTLVGQRLPRGLRYVFGTNMDDPDDCAVKREINRGNGGNPAANACDPLVSGTFRYSYIGNGFLGYQCLDASLNPVNNASGQSSSKSFVRADGSDPWDGNCVAGYTLVARVHAPRCYDGVNLWAPGGYLNFRYSLQNNNGNQMICPKNWFKVPSLEIAFYFQHQGFDDYKRWRLSSDDMAAQTAGHPFLSGSSFHTDWMNGWDDTTLFGSPDGSVLGWLKYCNGIADETPHSCDSSRVNANTRMVGGNVNESAPDNSRVPQVNISMGQFPTTTPSGMFGVPTTKGKGIRTINVKPK